MGARKSVIYFAYLGEDGTDMALVERRLAFMAAQLQWLSDLIAASGEPIEVLVAYLAPRVADADVDRIVARHGFAIDPESVSDDRHNRFEYPGFRAMKKLAQGSAPDDLIYYCHSKGIAQLSHGKMGLFRLHTATGLTADLARLEDDPGLTRATIFPSKFGWCFYNFFWIKAGYMAGLTVEESADRYHFEALVGEPGNREGYRGVLPLIDRLPAEDVGIEVKPWYRASETSSPALAASYQRYAEMNSPADGRRRVPRSFWTRLFG